MGVKNTMEYMSIRHRLMDLIVTGDGSERRIPASRKLAKQFGCTHPTVLRALRDLVAEGLLIPCKRGGYIITPLPGVAQTGMKIFGIVIQSGKQDFDTGFFEALYHAVVSELLDRSVSYCVRNIYLETPSRLATVVTQNSLSGLILILPIPAILKEVKKEIQKGLSAVSLYRKTEQMTSCDLSAETLYEDALERLYKEKRRNLLIVGADRYYYLGEVEKMLRRFRKHHPDADVTLLKENAECNFDMLSGLVRQGAVFDGAVFLLHDRKIYDFLCDRFDVEKQCRLVADQFAVFRDMNFTGWKIHFDLPGAACFLIDALLRTPDSTEYLNLKADFRFYLKGTVQ